MVYATYLCALLAPAFFVRRTLPYALGLERRRSVEAYESDHTGGSGGVSRVLARPLAGAVRASERGHSRPRGSTPLTAGQRTAQTRQPLTAWLPRRCARARPPC